MNKPLDDLFKQADAQLQTLDAEIKDKQASTTYPEEIDRATAARFNSMPPYMSNHPVRTLIVSVLMSLIFMASIYTLLTMPKAEGPYRVVTGTVRSSAIVRSGGVHWGSVAKEQVVLPDGRVVSIRSDGGLLLKPGTSIAMRLYDTGAITSDRMLQIYRRTVVGHDGGFPGVNTNLPMILGSPYTVVILANQDPSAAALVENIIVPLMVEKAKSGQ